MNKYLDMDDVALRMRGLREEAEGLPNPGVTEASPPPQGVNLDSPPDSVNPSSQPENDSGMTENAQNRIRQLANQRSEARAWAEKIAAENQQLRGYLQQAQMVEGQKAAENQERAKEQHMQQLAFNEPFPDEGDEDEQLQWKIRKEAHGIATEQTYKGLSAFATMMAPTLSAQVNESRNREWKAMDKSLKPYGASRKAIEGTVNAIIQREPHRSLRSAVFDAMDIPGFLHTGGGGSVPQVATPGSGRTEPAATPERQPTEADNMRNMMDLAREQGKANMPHDSLRTLAGIFEKGRSAAN